MNFVMAGGGTGGHVIPAIAVARELVRAGHNPIFVGTERGVESRLVPATGFRLEKIRVGGLKNLGLLTKATGVWRLFVETWSQFRRFAEWRPAAVFSMGGYVAGPPVLAGLLRRVPVVIMEPNAVPGVTNRWIAPRVARALISFDAARSYFPADRTEVTGLPVRDEFFAVPPKQSGNEFTVLITGGSQGSRTLNLAVRGSWQRFRESAERLRIIHQTGEAMHAELSREFAASGLAGGVVPFIPDMANAFANADLVVCRAGAGAVAELAAAGRPSILVPFPFAADDHQTKNAEAMRSAGAAIAVSDSQFTPDRFYSLVSELMADPDRLRSMSEAARSLAKPGAAHRAAQILIEVSENSGKTLTAQAQARNNSR